MSDSPSSEKENLSPPPVPQPGDSSGPANGSGGDGQSHLSLLAIASLFLGIFGLLTLLLFFVGLIPAVAALICGHLALIRIRVSKRGLYGRWAAMIGLFSGYLTVFLAPLIAIGLVIAFPHIEEYVRQGQESARLDHASELYRACENFARDHEGDYPESWDNLSGRYLSARQLERLLSDQRKSLLARVKAWVSRDSTLEDSSEPAFVLVPHDRPVLRELEGSVIVIREIAPSDVERTVVAYDNGQTAMIANPNRE